jgi:hypothetical protein
MYRPFFFSVCVVVLLISFAFGRNHKTDPPLGQLPKSFDSPFTPQHINPDTATISISPGFEQGRYDIHIALSETTLYDSSHSPARNYNGVFILQGIKLPTDDFYKLMGTEFKDMADEQSIVTIEFTQTPRRDEHIQKPFGQRYPVSLRSIRFGHLQLHAIYTEIVFQVDFAAVGPPNPWTSIASVTPYQLARKQVDYSLSGYSKEEWEAFCALVKETEAIWRTAKYSTNIRLLLNYRYESSMGMNTHER